MRKAPFAGHCPQPRDEGLVGVHRENARAGQRFSQHQCGCAHAAAEVGHPRLNGKLSAQTFGQLPGHLRITRTQVLQARKDRRIGGRKRGGSVIHPR